MQRLQSITAKLTIAGLAAAMAPSVTLAQDVAASGAASRTDMEGATIEAPVYRPARGYSPPTIFPSPLGARISSLRQLMTNKAAWAIVTKEVPATAAVAASPMAAPFLENFSMQVMIDLGLATPADLDRVDARLKTLESAQ